MKKRLSISAPKNWVQFLYTTCILLLPFVYLDSGVDPVLIPRQVLLNIFIGVEAILLWKTVRPSFAIQSALPLLFLALAVCYLFSVSHALNQIEGWYISLKVIGFFLFFLVMYWGFKHQAFKWEQVVLGIAISGILASGLAMRDMIYLQSNGVPIFVSDHMYRVNATFGHKNLLSAYLFITLPMLLMQYWFQQKRTSKLLFLIFALIQFCIIMVLQTRAVIFGIGIALSLLVVLVVFHNHASKKLRSTILFLLLAFAVLGGVLVLNYSDKLTLLTRTESFIERKNVWDNTWQMIKEYPFAGVGAGNWQIYFPKYGMEKFYLMNYTITEGFTTFQRPHNDFLWVLAETGMIGGLCYFLFWGLSLYLSVFSFYRASETRHIVLHGLIIFQLVGFGFISLVDFPLERIEHLWVMLSTAAWIAAGNAGKFTLKIPRYLTWMIVVLAVYNIYVCGFKWKSERIQKMVHYAHAKHNATVLIKAGQASINKYANMDHFSMPLSWYIGVGYFLNNNTQTAKQYFAKAYSINPYQVHVINNYAACFVSENNYDEAIPLLEKSNSISPTFSEGILNLAGAYYNVSRFKDAYKVLSTFKYDEQNDHFKVVAVIVLRKILDFEISKMQPESSNRLPQFVTTDEELLNLYKEAQLNNTDFLTYTLKQHKANDETL